jgi:hypothetical protein
MSPPPINAPPIKVPPPPISPTAATSATASACGSRHDEHHDSEIAVLAELDAVLLADASARIVSRVPGIVGGVEKPRGHPV